MDGIDGDDEGGKKGDLYPVLHFTEPGPQIAGRCCANDGPCGDDLLGKTSVFEKRFEYGGDDKMILLAMIALL